MRKRWKQMDKALWIFGIVSAGLIWLLIMACCMVAGRSYEADGKYL